MIKAPPAKTKEAFSVWVNSDLTEGRGFDYPKYICSLVSTANRLAKGANVQGSDGCVVPVTLEWRDLIYKGGGYWFGPVSVESPSSDDIKQELILVEEEALKKRKDEILVKARSLGLSDEEIELLRKS